MNALPLILFFLAVIAIGYRYYSAFLAAKVMALDDARVTPSHRFEDGQNYVPTNKWVLFGHHFAAISGAGPLIGPVLAAQFGYLPGLLWLAFGVVLAGAVHDFTVLVASMRRNGRSLAEIARSEISPVAGVTAMIAILFIVIIALAGLGIAVVNALADSSWGTFTIFLTIPIALLLGLYLHKSKAPFAIRNGSIFGALAVLAAVVAGRFVPGAALGAMFTLSKTQILVAIAAYGFIASVLPVWMLLCPRDYLSSYMKLG
ncbi:MAG TPA: carbon starvation CstA family protein, partial [Thermoanaerobaculia bacterium]|nr:carbon starvation CstA family protein [Thermoanaerobaculia bacterium]